MLKANTLIKRNILMKKALNTKIDGIIYLVVLLSLAVVSLDLKLVFKVCEFLSEE